MVLALLNLSRIPAEAMWILTARNVLAQEQAVERSLNLLRRFERSALKFSNSACLGRWR